jgi:hypothetical protein
MSDKSILIVFLNKLKDIYRSYDEDNKKNKEFNFNYLNEINRLLIIYIFNKIINISDFDNKNIKGGGFINDIIIKYLNNIKPPFNKNFISIPEFIDVIIDIINKIKEGFIIKKKYDNKINKIKLSNHKELEDNNKVRSIIINDIIKKILILIYYIIILNLYFKKIINGIDYNDDIFNDLNVILLFIKSVIYKNIDNYIYNYIYYKYINTKGSMTAYIIANLMLKRHSNLPSTRSKSRSRSQSQIREHLQRKERLNRGQSLSRINETSLSQEKRQSSISNKLNELKETSIIKRVNIEKIINSFDLDDLKIKLHNDLVELIKVGDNIILEMKKT